MPLGAQLIDMIADQIDDEAPRTKSDHFGEPMFDPARVVNWSTADRWHDNPIYGTVMRQLLTDRGLDSEKANAAHKEIQRIRDLLRNQTAETIDAFIAENPNSAQLTKLMLAAMLLKCCYRSGRKNYGEPLTARSFAARMLNCGHRHRDKQLPHSERNWIHLLINIIRHGIDTGRIKTKIRIVTFNYDLLLEHVLEEQFSNRETALGPYTDYVDIMHVHGTLGPLTATCQDPARIAAEWAKGICVVNEPSVPEAVKEARLRAREAIGQSALAYVVGFSFAGPNCRLIGLDQPSKARSRRLLYCNYDGNRGIAEAAKSYNVNTVEEVAGEWSRPLRVSDFIKGGYLGELPG